MSDELDQELRDQRWRDMAPDITDHEISVLDRLYDAQGKGVHRYGPTMMLAAYRLGIREQVGPKVRALLAAFIDDSPCRFDHHGGCQEHGFLDIEPGQSCPQRQLKAILASGTLP